MAEIAKLQVALEADTSHLEKGLDKAHGLVGNFGGALGTVAGIGFAGLAAGVVGVGGALVASGKSAADFQSQISGIAAVGGKEAVDRMSEISAKALQVGKDTAFSATEAAGGMEALIKAGVGLNDVLGSATDATVALAAATGVDLTTSAEIAANAMNQFHLQGADVADVADIIAGAANASAIDVKQFGLSLQSVGAVANLVGFSFKDTAVAIAEMGQAGIPASDAGTSLKTMLMSLQPVTKAQNAEFRKLGLVTADGANQFFDAAGKAKPLVEIQGILAEATKDLTREQKLASMEIMFGSDAIRAAAVLTDQGTAGYEKMSEAMGKVSAADVAKTRLDNLNGSLDALGGTLNTAAITIGTAFLPSLQLIVKGATDTINANMPLIEQFSAALPGAMAAAGAFITDTLMPALGNLAAALGPPLKATLDWLITTGWPTLTAAATKVSEWVTSTALPALGELATALGPPLQGVVNWLTTTGWPGLQKVGETLGLQIQGMTKFVQELWVEMLKRNIPDELGGAWDALYQVGATLAGSLLNDLNPQTRIAGAEMATARPPAEALADILKTISGAVKTTADQIVILNQTLQPAADLLNAVHKAGVDAGLALHNLGDWLNSITVPQALQQIADLVGRIAGGVSTGLSGLLNNAAGGGGGGQRGPNLLAANVGQNQVGLSPNDAAAACGPYAAMLFFNSVGRYPTAAEAVDLGRKAGWTPGAGMGGEYNFVDLLNLGGVNGTIDRTPTADEGRDALKRGSPVAISTAKHYFAATGIDEQDRFNVGGTGTLFKGGKEWMTLAEMDAIGGGLQAIITTSAQAGEAVTLAINRVATAGAGMAQSLAAGIGQGDTVVTGAVETIVQAAITNGIDPLIALALAKAESNFNPGAVGDNGASVGLFQLHERGQGAGMSKAQRADPAINAQKFLGAHKELYAQLTAEGMVGEQLAATFGRIAEGSDPQYAYRYAEAYRELVAQFGSANVAGTQQVASLGTLGVAQQQSNVWAETMATQQANLATVLQGQVNPATILTSQAMANLSAVLGPIERQVASGSISMDTLQFQLVDLARATGLATTPWRDYNAGLIDINEAMMRVVMQSADAGPAFEALRQQLGTTNAITDQGALSWLQLALNYQQATPAIAGAATATTTATSATTALNSATGTVNSTLDPGQYQAVSEAVKGMTDALGGASSAFGEMGSAASDALGQVESFQGAAESLADFLDSHTFHVKIEVDPVPAEFMPGSPTPFEMGLRGIADAEKHLGRVSMRGLRSLEMPSPSAAVRLVGSGSGGGTMVVNNYTANVPNFIGTKDELVDALHEGLLRKKRVNGWLSLGDGD